MKKILVVDDEPDILDVTAMRLQAHGYSVVTACDGQAALDAVKKENPDLILLDLALPKISGYDVCKIIKNDPVSKAIPVIIFTASASRSNVDAKMLDIKADDYLIKPFDPQELLAKIKKFLQE
jgi:DNA-binding response OmpR family regulator